MGIASFGYEEFGLYEEAAQLATIGLQINPRDGWSAHTRAHVYEMENHAREGIEFMMARVNDWTVRRVLQTYQRCVKTSTKKILNLEIDGDICSTQSTWRVTTIGTCHCTILSMRNTRTR
jgi:hypothetical protein